MSERTFEECIDEVKKTEDLEGLFKQWKEAHGAEAEEIAEEIEKIRNEDKGKCDGRIFQERIYKNCTISSHFIQFFYRDACKECAAINGKKVWQYVLEKAFNADGYIGDYSKKEYEYIVLLKEANDSDKNCIRKNYEKEAQPNQWLVDWIKDKKDVKDKKDGKYKMLNKLNNAFYEYLSEKCDKSNEKKEDFYFTEKMAYMNVNKRGGTNSTQGVDQDVLIQYAKRYREFILKEIFLLSGTNKEVTVFVCGKGNDYFKKLMNALCSVDVEEVTYGLKYPNKEIKFVNIPHPSGRISAEKLAEEMNKCKSI